MGEVYSEVKPQQQAWAARQSMFLEATAPLIGAETNNGKSAEDLTNHLGANNSQSLDNLPG